jgi:hypothetical protein
MNNKENHWTSEMLTLLGMWLWEQGEYGHGLLCIHGPQWGYKIGHQLNIVWDNILGEEDFKWELNLDEGNDVPRYTSEMARDYLIKLYEMKMDEEIDGGESIYLNSKTGKALTTSSLNRELKRFSELFIKELDEKHGWKVDLKPLKSNAFQIAGAFKMLEKYNYSKKAFIAVSKFMGHKSLKYTIDLLEIEPFDEIIFDFHSGNYADGIKSDALEDENEIGRIVLTTITDAYSQFKLNIAE